jgi:hypothetical protein
MFLCNDASKIKMAFYLVKAKPRKEGLEGLHGELNSGKISKMRPFGKSLQYSLENARIDTEDTAFALWVEEDYCSPPLAMEREAVLNRYFNDITVEKVKSENEAWSRLKDKPRFWSKQ